MEKEYKIVQIFPRDTDPKYGLLKEEKNGFIRFFGSNNCYTKKMVSFNSAYNVHYIHLTRSQYTEIWSNNRKFSLPKPANVSEVGTFADEDTDTNYFDIMNKLYK